MKNIRFIISLAAIGMWQMGCSGNTSKPTDILLSSSAVLEKSSVGTQVGQFSLEGGSDESTQFTLIESDINAFAIDGDTLVVFQSELLDFETAPSISITIEARQGKVSLSKDFLITVNDVVEVSSVLDAGQGSLRQAIEDANSGDVIYVENSDSKITLTSGPLVITKDITIIGAATSTAKISGNNAQQVFQVNEGATLTLKQLTVQDGFGASGACIYNDNSRVFLDQVMVDGCEADSSRRGGGIQSVGSNAYTEIKRSTIQNCIGFNGGGFSNDSESTMVISESLIQGNQTSGNSGAGGLNGGSTLEIINTTITNNQTTGSDRPGGGLANFSGGIMHLVHVTIIGNTATGEGGGIYSDGSLQIKNSIVAGNTTGETGSDMNILAGNIAHSTHNFIGDGTSSGLVHENGGNMVGTLGTPIDPDLSFLQNNGGHLSTFLPNSGSPVIDAVPNTNCKDYKDNNVAFDARGLTRPKGSGCDMGSVEVQ